MFKKVVAFILVLALLLPIGSALATRYYRVSTSWLKAHEKASFSSTVVNKYRRDTAVTIAKKYSGGWAKVRFRPGGKAVFVQSKYLKLCESYTAYVSKNGTNLRKGPATSFPILGVLDTGAKVTVLTHSRRHLRLCFHLQGQGLRRQQPPAEEPALPGHGLHQEL